MSDSVKIPEIEVKYLASDEICSRSQFVHKWLESLAVDIRGFLRCFYVKGDCDLNAVKASYEALNSKLKYLTPVLLDCFIPEIDRLDDMLTLAYGVGSDEVYMYRHFCDLCLRYPTAKKLDADVMWNDCADNERLKSILL